MKITRLIIMALPLFVITNVFAQNEILIPIKTIKNSRSFCRITKRIKDENNALYVFDIDNTLLVTNNNRFGSDWWYAQTALGTPVAESLKLNVSNKCLYDVLTPLFYAMFDTASLFKKQDKYVNSLGKGADNSKTIALTSRGYTKSIAASTEIELSKNKYVFIKKYTTKLNDDESILLEKYTSQTLTNATLCNNVIYTEGHNKGEILLQYVKNNKYSKIYYFDDSESKVKDVQKSFSASKVKFDIAIYHMKVTPKIPYTKSERTYMECKLDNLIKTLKIQGDTALVNAQFKKEEGVAFQSTSDFYSNLVSGEDVQISYLNLFFTNMPKGGDLHHHYTGTIYVETYLEWVQKNGWKIDKCSLKIVTDKTSQGCELLDVDQVLKDHVLYRRLLSLWSDKDYNNHFHNQPPPDQNFFNTFGYFGAVSNEFMNEGLHILKQRAINENVQYIETMLSSVGTSSKNYASRVKMIEALRKTNSQKELDMIFEEIDAYYNKDEVFNKQIKQFVKKVKTVHQGIDDAQFTMRFQSYAARVTDPLEVYTDLLSAFIASEESKLIVGVNIVAPENNNTAMKDYTLHMMMFNYLARKYPKVKRALHAGELTLGMVRPKNLVFHIDEALNIAHANRIGHGIDIVYENNSIKLLENLKKNSVIEINLTSNEFILGVKDNEHPYTVYSKFKVPMVISTDDSGVSRNNLTAEFVLLASRYKPSYKEIKMYVYNSIKYSFLEEEEKDKQQKMLDDKFNMFEQKIAALTSKMNE